MNTTIFIVLVGSLALTTADFRSDALQATNTYRAKHGAGPLTQNSTIDSVAQAHAEKLVALGYRLEHSNNQQYGENLYGYSGPVQSQSQYAIDAVNAWYGEVKDYDFNKPGFSSKTSQFTALVWKGTMAQGIGVATNPRSKYTVVVANYSPPGNVLGQYEQNVGRPVASG